MTTNATIGHRTLFEINDGSGYVAVGEITSITLPSLSRDAIDATHTESEDGWREFIPGLKDAGEVTIEMNFVPPGSGGESPDSSSDVLIRSQFDRDDLTACRITLPGNASPSEVLTFNAIFTGYEVEGPVDDKMTATLTLKVSGKVTYSSGS